MYELIINNSRYFKIEQEKSDYYLISLGPFTLLPGHTKLNTLVELNFDRQFICLFELERRPIDHGLILQAVDFPENILHFDVINLKNTPFFVEANTRIAKINFTKKQFLDSYIIFKNCEINQQ